MSAGVWFWIIYVICGILFVVLGWPYKDNARLAGGGLIVYILIGLLGWGAFGPPIK